MAGRRGAVALVLLALTAITTTMWGAIYAYGYFEDAPLAGWYDAFRMPRYALLGFVLYALPLLAILGAHELGHHVAMRRAGLRASPPWFLPLPPPLSASGTFGAVIGLADRIPDRRTLVRVAAAGPLAGLVVAVAVLVVGFALTPADAPAAATEGGLAIQAPLLFDLLSDAMGVPREAAVHPLATAGWLGLFVTAVQLVPAGQLDGGHLARAFLGRRHPILGWVVVAGLVALAILFGFYGWIVLALVVWLTGLRAPPATEEGDVGALEVALTLLCVATFALTFVPRPFAG